MKKHEMVATQLIREINTHMDLFLLDATDGGFGFAYSKPLNMQEDFGVFDQDTEINLYCKKVNNKSSFYFKLKQEDKEKEILSISPIYRTFAKQELVEKLIGGNENITLNYLTHQQKVYDHIYSFLSKELKDDLNTSWFKIMYFPLSKNVEITVVNLNGKSTRFEFFINHAGKYTTTSYFEDIDDGANVFIPNLLNLIKTFTRLDNLASLIFFNDNSFIED